MTLKFLKNILNDLLTVLGAITIFIALVTICPNFRNNVEENSIAVIYYSLGISIFSVIAKQIYLHCRQSIKKTIKFPETTIEIKYGDIFEEKEHLVIGCNDCFDTELGEVISPYSIQGQFEKRFYKDNIDDLNKEIEQDLKSKGLEPSYKHNKKLGKKEYYPLGTTVTLGDYQKRYFLCAYSKMNDNCKAESNLTWLQFSLLGLWDEIRNKGQFKEIAMPLIGSGLARANENRMILLSNIILSFISCSMTQKISEKLTIVLRKEDRKYYKIQQIEELLNSLLEGQ